MREAGTPLRGIAAMLFAAAGLLHVAAAVEHAEEPVLQAGFAVVASLQVLVAGIVLREPRPPRWLLAGAIAMQIASIGLWLLSRTQGLPELLVPGGHVEPVGVRDAVCVLFEVLSVPAAMLLLSPAVRGLPLRSPRVARASVAGVALVTAALLVPAMIAAGGRGPLRLDADLVAQLVEGHGAGGHTGTAHRASSPGHRGSHARRPGGHTAHAGRGSAHGGHASPGGGSSAGSEHAGHGAGVGDGAQLASAHAGHAGGNVAPGTPSHAHHQAGGTSQGSRGSGGAHHHHHHGQQGPKAPAPQRPSPTASAASQPAPSSPPPGPCDPGAPGTTTVVDAAGTRVVVQPSSTGGAPVHVCR